MRQIVKIVQAIVIIAAIVLGLGYCGQMDLQYEEQRAEVVRR